VEGALLAFEEKILTAEREPRSGALFVQTRLDNMTAISYLFKEGGRVAPLNDIARRIFRWCRPRDVHLLRPTYVPSKEMEADAPSRWRVQHDYFLSNDALERLCRDLNVNPRQFSLEPFRRPHVGVASRFCGRFRQAGSLGGPFDLPWTGETLFLFPPPSLMSRSVSKLRSDRARALVIHPEWEASWRPSLRAHTVACLPVLREDFLVGPSNFHPNEPNPKWRFSASWVDFRPFQI
jgi:hypothetical protein